MLFRSGAADESSRTDGETRSVLARSGAGTWLSGIVAFECAVTMFPGFFAWYRGLAIGPMTRVSQIQLIQPVLSICWAGLLLGETLTWATFGGGLAVVLCAGAAVRHSRSGCNP